MTSVFSNQWVVTIAGGLIVAIVGGIFLIRIQESRTRKRSLSIVKATYGNNNKFVDITDQLNSYINKGRLEVVLSNDIAGDPIEGVPKIGRIKYRSDGKIYNKEYVEMEKIKLS